MVSNDDVKYVELEAAKRAMARFIGYGQIDEDMVKRFEIALELLAFIPKAQKEEIE